MHFSFLSFLLKILEKRLNSVIIMGFFCGLMTALTVGLGHLLAGASFFFKDNQKRVAILSGFLTGQLIMFLSIYHEAWYRALVQPHCIISIFLSSLFLQLLWTRQKTLRNTQFLDPDDIIIMIIRRVLRLQLEFMMTFFVQICNPHLEPDSLIPRLVNFCLSSYNNDNRKKIFFVGCSFAAWLIGQIFLMIVYMKLFQLIVNITIWVRKNFFESED